MDTVCLLLNIFIPWIPSYFSWYTRVEIMWDHSLCTTVSKISKSIPPLWSSSYCHWWVQQETQTNTSDWEKFPSPFDICTQEKLDLWLYHRKHEETNQSETKLVSFLRLQYTVSTHDQASSQQLPTGFCGLVTWLKRCSNLPSGLESKA